MSSSERSDFKQHTLFAAIRSARTWLTIFTLCASWVSPAYAYTQWEWRSVGIIETDFNSVVDAGPSTTFNTKEQAAGAIPRVAAYQQVLTQYDGSRNIRNGQVEFRWIAPHVDLNLGPWNNFSSQASFCAAGFATEAAVRACLENWYSTQVCSGTVTVPSPTTWTAVPSFPLTQESGVTHVVAPACSANNTSIGIIRARNVSCPAGYSIVQQACKNSYAAVVSVGAMECPVGSPSAQVGNPCNAATGDKSQAETDYVAPGIEFNRHYHSATPSSDASLGIGWTHNYSARILFEASEPAVLIRPQGTHEIVASSGGNIRSVSGSGTRLFHIGTEWHARLSNGDTEIYSATGELQQIAHRAGSPTTLYYVVDALTAMRSLTSVVGPFGHRLDFSYANGRIDSVATSDGATIHYTYDTAANLVRVTFQDGANRQYLYEDSRFPNALTGIRDENGVRHSTYSYDTSGRAASSERANGAGRITLTYNTNNSVVTDAAGLQTTYIFNQAPTIPRRVSGITRNAVTEQFQLEGNTERRVTHRVDRRGFATDFTYDADHLLTQTEAVGTPRERKTTYGYLSPEDDLVNLETLSTPSGGVIREISTTYDAQRLPKVQTVTGSDGSGGTVSRTTVTLYTAAGQVQSIDGPRTDLNDIVSFGYYICDTGFECGQLKTVTNALSQVVTYNSYNAHGQPTKITDPNGLVTSLAYDLRQRLKDRCAGGTLPGCSGGLLTHLDYWPTGKLKRVTNPDGSLVEYTYDDAHRLTQINDGALNKIVYTLDAMGNRTAENVYDPTSALKRTHSRVFNTLNQFWKDVNAAGTANVTTVFGYDNNDNLTTTSAPLSRNSTNSYDELNRLKQVIDSNSGNTVFGYDAIDNLTSVTDPRSLVTSYTYTGLGDVKTQVSPDTGTTNNTYDSGGNLKTSTDARGAVTTYSYDALNRVTAAEFKQGSTVEQTINYTYDTGVNGKGHLTSASDAEHTMTWDYDSKGRVTGKTQVVTTVTPNVSKFIGYHYNAAGQSDSILLPSGQTIGYSYNSNGQVSAVTLVGTPTVTILSNVTYDPFGPVTGWTWGNGTSTSRTFDTDGKQSQITSAGQRTFGYDDAFRITAANDLANPTNSWTLGYDLLDRLNSASKSGTSFGYTYDAVGNRLAQTGSNASTYAISSTSNRLNSTAGALARTYQYDTAGNVLKTGVSTHAYNKRGRLRTSRLDSAGSNTGYYYNALGQRIRKNGGTPGNIYFVYDESGHLVGEYTTTTLVQETVWLGDVPVAILRPKTGGGVDVFYVHTDQLNTPRKVTRPSDNKVRWSWDPTPFGEGAPNENPQSLGTFTYNLRFPGQYFDVESNFNYNYFRDYDPASGRYVESDPIGLNGGTNTYAYVRSRPTKRVDPRGLCDQCNTSTTAPHGNTIEEVARSMIARYLTASIVSGVEYCAWICQEPNLKTFFSMPAQQAPIEGLSGSCLPYLLQSCPECSIRRALWHTHYPDAEGNGEGLSGGDKETARDWTTGRVDQYGNVSQPTAQGIQVYAGSPSRRIDYYNGINGAHSPILSPQLRPGEGLRRTNY